MGIKKRLTNDQRVKRQLPKGWKAALTHPLMQKASRASGITKPKHIVDAIYLTSKWKGATWGQKVFVLALDTVMEKAFDKAILTPDNYNRLQEHLMTNDDKMFAASFLPWMIWCWDLHHDHYKLHDLANGELSLRTPKTAPKHIPRRRLKKHR